VNSPEDARSEFRKSFSAWQKAYKPVSLVLAIAFLAVGTLFLIFPEAVVNLFNALSRTLGMVESNEQGNDFYRILAVGYMYVVTLLAYQMYRHPGDEKFLWLLVNAKGASSVLSFLFFVLHHPYLIYLTNGIVDGGIAVGLVVLRMKTRRNQQ